MVFPTSGLADAARRIRVLRTLLTVALSLGVAGCGGGSIEQDVSASGLLIYGCPMGTGSTQITFDYQASGGGGTLDSPSHPYSAVGRELPYKDELIRIGDSLVRPDPDGPGNDVVYELMQYQDGTYVVNSVTFCNRVNEAGNLIERDEFETEPTELTDESRRRCVLRRRWDADRRVTQFPTAACRSAMSPLARETG